MQEVGAFWSGCKEEVIFFFSLKASCQNSVLSAPVSVSDKGSGYLTFTDADNHSLCLGIKANGCMLIKQAVLVCVAQHPTLKKEGFLTGSSVEVPVTSKITGDVLFT